MLMTSVFPAGSRKPAHPGSSMDRGQSLVWMPTFQSDAQNCHVLPIRIVALRLPSRKALEGFLRGVPVFHGDWGFY